MGLAWNVCILAFFWTIASSTPDSAEATELAEAYVRAVQDEMKPYVQNMIRHAFDQYMSHGFPKDEVHPVSCTGADTMGGFALTLVDSLDLLALSGYHDEFRRHAKWVAENINFNKDHTVSVFETSIRVLGGLLSAHFMYEHGIVAVDPVVEDYNGALLQLAVELGDRLLPAFDTPTGIPFGSINLQLGVSPTEIDITSTAGGGTFLPEFTVLSAVTGDRSYESAARRAYRALFHFRSHGLGLVGNHINISNGQWTIEVASVGSGVDSFVEYGIKSYLLTGIAEYRAMFSELRDSFHRYTRKGPFYVGTQMSTGTLVQPTHSSLAAFYPGNLALAGIVDEAAEVAIATHAIAKKLGALPEGFSVLSAQIEGGQAGFPLRPEHAESLYMLFRTTRDVTFLEMAKELALMINTRTRTRCGFSALNNVELPPRASQLTDTMESFILAETLKYLLLIFDDDNPLHHFQQQVQRHSDHKAPFFDTFGFTHSGGRSRPVPWIFNTEGHPIPVTAEWRKKRTYGDEYDGTIAALMRRFDERRLFEEHRCFTEPSTELDTLPRDIFRRDHWSGGGL
jgi:mannosidase alpha-like ER degradation enhancer 2